MPISRSEALTLLDGKPQTVPVNDGRGNIVYQLSKVEMKLDWKLSVPIFSDDGIWLLGTLSTAKSSESLTPDAPQADSKAQAEDTEREIEQLMTEVAKLEKGIFAPPHDVTLWVDSRLLQKFANKVITEHSTVEATMVSHSDFVYQSGDTLYVALDKVSGNVNLAPPVTKWDDAKGFYLSVSATATAKANLRIQARTKLGSATIPAEITGSAHNDEALAGWINPEVMKSPGGSAMLLGANLECRVINAHFEGGGSMKYDARTSFYINQRQLGATVLVDTVPFYGPLGSGKQTLEITIEPEDAVIKNRGFLLSSRLSVKVVGGTPTDEDLNRQHDAIKKFADSVLALRLAPACPNLPYTEVTIAGQEFGPNNYFLNNLAAIADTAKSAVDLPVTFIDDVWHGKPPSEVLNDFGKGMNKFKDSVVNEFNKVFNTNISL